MRSYNIKVIGRNKTHYPTEQHPNRGRQVRPTDRRASQIQGDFEKKLGRIDSPNGRLVGRLRSFGPVKGFVVGAYGEVSQDLKEFVNAVVESKMCGRAMVQQAAASYLYTKVRRTIGVAAARAHAAMVIEGVKYCGPGGEEAYRRRHEVKQQADKYKADLDAAWHARYHHTHASLHGMHSRLEFGSW